MKSINIILIIIIIRIMIWKDGIIKGYQFINIRIILFNV